MGVPLGPEIGLNTPDRFLSAGTAEGQGPLYPLCACPNTVGLAQRAESRAHFGGVQLRLLPGGEVPAPSSLKWMRLG